MASLEINDNVEGDIRDGYVQSHSIGDASKVERYFDKTIDMGTALPDSAPLTFVKTFYEQNQDVIKSTATGLASLTSEGKSIESVVSNLSETAKVMIKGLDALAQVHPVVGVAVLAFKAVVTLDMTRRENNKKVLALKIEMQDMMAVLFELRHIRDLVEPGPDGTQLGARMQTLMDKFAKDIKEAGSACDAYMKKSLLARTLKSMIYEERLAKYGSTFEGNKTELQRALSMHTARGVSTANEKLDSVETKIDHVLELFGKLDSPREKDIRKFLEKHGGDKACIEDDDLLAELVWKSGESLSGASGQMGGGDGLGGARKALLRELQEDVDEMFKKNFVTFERKLEVQLSQIHDAILMSSEYIVNSLRSGSDEKILDPDLRAIWKEMGWRGSVKARHLVLAIHDYFSDRRPPLQVLDTKVISSSTDDQWSLAYINVAYVQPILESLDDDASGFVSINEVNTFTTSAPRDWSLLQRLAYWAIGWHISVSSYKKKIYKQIQQMFKLRDRMRASNRRLANEYLSSCQITSIEHILRALNPVEKYQHDEALEKLINKFDQEEEERLAKNLARVAYDLDTVETVGLITGPGRIERYLLPLVHILLKRDLRIMTLACRCTLHEEELTQGLKSFWSVFQVVDERIESITGIFRQLYADINVRLGTFAFGMFTLYYEVVYDKDEIRMAAIRDSISRLSERDSIMTGGDEDLQAEIQSIPASELKHGPFYLTSLEDGFMNPPSPRVADIPEDSTPSGHWSGHFWTKKPDGYSDSHLGLTEWRIEVLTDGKIQGEGQSFAGSLTMDGELDENNGIKLHLEFWYGHTFVCEGTFDPDHQSIKGSWKPRNLDLTSDSSPNTRELLFWRTPTHLYRFRYETEKFLENPARARWNFARDAILHEVRRKSWSQTYFKSNIGELKRLLALSIRKASASRNIASSHSLTDEDVSELAGLWTDVPVYLSRMCIALAGFHIDRRMVFHDGTFCDYCGHTLYETRILCLVCVGDDPVADHIDACRPCMTAPVTTSQFVHKPSHSMIKYEYAMEGMDEALASLDIVARAKAALKAVEQATSNDAIQGKEVLADQPPTSPSVSVDPILCLCCSKPVTTPCWICRVCTPDTFICLDCEENRHEAPKGHPHKLSDPLIRLGTTDPDPKPQTDQNSLEERLANLERKVDERTNELQERLVQLETNIQERFSVLESLLRQVVSGQQANGPSVI